MAPINPGAPLEVSPDPAIQVDEIDLGTISANAQAYGRAAVFHGFSVLESTGAAVAKLRIRDGSTAAGSVLARIGLAAGAGQTVLVDNMGVRAVSGLFVEVVSGSVEVTLYARGLESDLS